MKHGINPYRTADFLDATPFVFYAFVMLAVMMDSILLGTGRFNSIAPYILLGRLRHDRMIGYQYHSDLILSFEIVRD